jgi:hypothetical protein
VAALFNREADHVHALISRLPNINLLRFVNNLSTHLLRRDFRKASIMYTSRSWCSGRGQWWRRASLCH